MHSTKTEILAQLKRNDGATVEDLASSLRLAPMTIRQHLTALERDDLIDSVEVRRATGRPHYHYRLTSDGHRRVSDGYDRMLTLLVEHVGSLDGPDHLHDATPLERRARLFRTAATALGERHRAAVLALDGTAQAERIVAILQEYGGFAEWHISDGGFEVRDFSCVYRASVAKTGFCAWHAPFLDAILGGDIEAAEEPDGCAACCRYMIRSRRPSPVPS
ncbi:MAG: helix-turn-helix domain-containing protein [Chloroflexota bacterium]|nr:helix-turn-helix domain-containing protein [Chloroflexota bacterium]